MPARQTNTTAAAQILKCTRHSSNRSVDSLANPVYYSDASYSKRKAQHDCMHVCDPCSCRAGPWTRAHMAGLVASRRAARVLVAASCRMRPKHHSVTASVSCLSTRQVRGSDTKALVVFPRSSCYACHGESVRGRVVAPCPGDTSQEMRDRIRATGCECREGCNEPTHGRIHQATGNGFDLLLPEGSSGPRQVAFAVAVFAFGTGTEL